MRTPRTGVATGEAVFNTVLSGYQEVITDPSYAGQVIAFTYPHIGNYGVNPTDDEAPRPHCKGVIVRDLAERPSSWRSTGSLEEFLVRHSIPGMTGVDTRRLTRHLRDQGAMPCAFGTAGRADLARGRRRGEADRRHRPGERCDARRRPWSRGQRSLPGRRLRLRHQRGDGAPAGGAGHRHRRAGARPRRPRCSACEPDGIFLSNGPGDPAALPGRRRADPQRARRRVGAGLRHLPRPPAARPPRSGRAPTSCPSATTAATTRCGGWRPAGSRSPRRTTTTRSPLDSLVLRSRSPTST